MKIFVSSLMTGYEPLRDAARTAIRTLRHEPVMAEDFGARPHSSQIACLRGVREADLVVLILTDRYGSIPDGSTVSPTHEEFLEARDTKPVLVFVQDNVTREALQAKFVDEVQAWQGGYFRNGFTTPEELRDRLITALYDHALATAASPLDVDALSEAAVALLPNERRGSFGSSGPTLNIAFASGPVQRLLRPAALESPELAENIQREAMFGKVRLLDRASGTSDRIDQTALIIEQERGASIRLTEDGALVLQLPLDRGERSSGLQSLIQETITERLGEAIAFADWTLESIDKTQRLTHVAIAVSIGGDQGYLGWRTRAEQAASPNSATVSLRMGDVPPPIVVDRHRAALRHEAPRLAEDLMVLLRRQRTSRQSR